MESVIFLLCFIFYFLLFSYSILFSFNFFCYFYSSFAQFCNVCAIPHWGVKTQKIWNHNFFLENISKIREQLWFISLRRKLCFTIKIILNMTIEYGQDRTIYLPPTTWTNFIFIGTMNKLSKKPLRLIFFRNFSIGTPPTKGPLDTIKFT